LLFQSGQACVWQNCRIFALPKALVRSRWRGHTSWFSALKRDLVGALMKNHVLCSNNKWSSGHFTHLGSLWTVLCHRRRTLCSVQWQKGCSQLNSPGFVHVAHFHLQPKSKMVEMHLLGFHMQLLWVNPTTTFRSAYPISRWLTV